MKKSLLVFISVLTAHLAFAQPENLAALIAKLQTTFGKVQTSSKTYEQEIKLMEFSSVRYAYDEIDLKGTKISYAYEFNLSDIDPYAVRQVTQKDVLLVVLAVRNKQKLVKGTKNSELQAYDDQVNIYAKDVDQARDIIDIVKKCIPLGEKITNTKFKMSVYEEMVSWITGNVKDVVSGSKSMNQSMVKGDYPGSFKFLQIESDGKTSHQEEFIFNLADVNLNALTYKISGNSFGLNIEMTQRLKLISVTRDGKPESFAEDVTIFTNNVDEARDMKTVLSLAAPLAQAKIKAEMPALKTRDEALQAIAALTKDVRIGDKTEGQSILAKCATSFTIVEQTPSATVKNVYNFNWMDINPNTFRVQVSGEKMMMELPTLDKKKVAMNSKNDKLDGYESEIDIYLQDMEVGRRMKDAVEKAVGYCKSEYKDPFASNSNPAAILEWLKNAVGEVIIDQVTQKVVLETPEADNLNKVKLTTRNIKSSSSVEEVFEFNLSDINPNSVDFEIKGKWLFVKFETNFRSKIIKAYKDGKIQPYAYDVDMAMRDIETSRGVISGMKKCIEAFKTK